MKISSPTLSLIVKIAPLNALISINKSTINAVKIKDRESILKLLIRIPQLLRIVVIEGDFNVLILVQCSLTHPPKINL